MSVVVRDKVRQIFRCLMSKYRDGHTISQFWRGCAGILIPALQCLRDKGMAFSNIKCENGHDFLKRTVTHPDGKQGKMV